MLARALALACLTIVGALPAWWLDGWTGTEGRRVQIALEMLRAGEWMVPTLGGEPTWAKPPLHYWLLRPMLDWFGVVPWAARLPSVLLTAVTAVTAMELLRRWFGRGAGWIGGLGIALSPLVLFEWPTAEIDPVFACFTAMSLWMLATGVGRQSRGLVVASGVLAGLALLSKGPPFFLFAVGAYLVWWRRRGLRFALAHFAPMLAVVAAYFAPLWLFHVPPSSMLAVASDESVGRLAYLDWDHIVSIPSYWLRAVVVQAPFVFWCFWEWRGARDARMDDGDLTLRMCSGAAVVAVALLTFFPGRPTRYLLPNVMLFTFAVTPAVAHYARLPIPVGPVARRFVRGVGIAAAVAMLVLPFVPAVGVGAVALAAATALAAAFVARPWHVVALCLAVPLVAAWTVGLERAWSRPDNRRAQEPAAVVLRRELDALGATPGLGMHGHVEGPLLLAADLLPRGDESGRTVPTAAWVIAEVPPGNEPVPGPYRARLRLCLPTKTFVVAERVDAPR